MNELLDGESFGVSDNFHNGAVEIKDFDIILGDGGWVDWAIGC